MDHWEAVILQPGFYSVNHGSNADVRQAAVPMTQAAEHVARAYEPEMEMFPFADQGDMTSIRVVLIEDSEDIAALEYQAELINEQLEYEAARLEFDPVAA